MSEVKIKVDKAKLMRQILRGEGVKLKTYTPAEAKQATGIMQSLIREIKASIPELVVALGILELYPVDLPINISTDFKHLFFSPKDIIRLHENKEDETIKFELLHIIIHGLLGDNETVIHERQSKTLWLSLDQRVDEICRQLGYMPSKKNEELGSISFYLNQMKNNPPYMNCFGNYQLAKKNKFVKKKAKAAQRLIASDEHFFWSPIFVKKIQCLPYQEGSEQAEPEKTDANQLKETIQNWKNARSVFLQEKSNDSQNLAKSMKDSAEKVKSKGSGAGNCEIEVKEAKGEPVDYKELLKEVLHELEDPRELPDSIDPMYYQFGLDNYGDVPLIEPREGDEILKLHTIAVAIDTSGSCQGIVAQRFCREVIGLINDSKEMLSGGKILCIQCDAEIQKEDLIDIQDLKSSAISYDAGRIFGGGGTSFIPVFNRLDELEQEGKTIDALVYLTDGWGDYPPKEPDYPTIFVLDRDYESEMIQTNIPAWIQKGYINR